MAALAERDAERRAQGDAKRQAGGVRKRQAGEGGERPADWDRELQQLAHSFKRLFRNVRRLRGRDTHLGGSDVSHAQFELLTELHDRGALPVGELAAAAHLTPATVTQMLDHLVEAGHVERKRSDADRRVVVAALTKSGRRKVSEKRAAWQSRWESALAGMSREELQAAQRVLDRLASMFDETPLGSCGQD